MGKEGIQSLPSEIVNDPFAGVDWDNPVQGGQPADGLKAAESYLGFQAYEPNELQAPDSVIVTGGPQEKIDDRTIALLYDTPDYGRVALIEYEAQVSADVWLADAEAAVKNTGEPGYYGSAQIITLRDGAAALLTTTPDGKMSVIEWLEAGIDLTVAGPSLDATGAAKYADAVVGT